MKHIRKHAPFYLWLAVVGIPAAYVIAKAIF